MNGQAEEYFGIVMDMPHSMLIPSGMEERYLDLTVQHATYLKNRLSSASLGERCFLKWFSRASPTHVRIHGSRFQVWLLPQEREGISADISRAGRYGRHSDSGPMCIALDETSNR